MNHIKIEMSSPVKAIDPIKPSTTHAAPLQNAPMRQPEPSSGMTHLLDIVNSLPKDDQSLEAFAQIKQQVHTGQYSFHLPMLAEHLFQELSIEGDFS